MKKDIESLSHTRWKCRYHIFLHQNIVEKLSMESIKRVLGEEFENYAKGKT